MKVITIRSLLCLSESTCQLWVKIRRFTTEPIMPALSQTADLQISVFDHLQTTTGGRSGNIWALGLTRFPPSAPPPGSGPCFANLDGTMDLFQSPRKTRHRSQLRQRTGHSQLQRFSCIDTPRHVRSTLKTTRLRVLHCLTLLPIQQ